MDITIKDVKTILTAPQGVNLVVVKIYTSEPEIYGLGCATFTQRHLNVALAVEKYLKPFLIGKDVQRIEDIWQTAMVSGYWRNGPEFNNAVSGVDMALWDIKGKIAGLPVYQLLGGKCREAAIVYKHAEGDSKEEVAENVQRFMDEGYQYIRCQVGGYGGGKSKINTPINALPGAYFEPKTYMRNVVDMFEYLRNKFGWDIDFIHDVHERLSPTEAMQFAKRLEPYQLYYLEDALPPEQISWFEQIRQHSSTPIAMGELFNNPNEWLSLISNRMIDFIRVHVSQIGGITPAKKLSIISEAFGVRTAWHGPHDVSPVGHAANIHLDVSSMAFGIQEWQGFDDLIHEMFPGSPVEKNGYVYPNDLPGLGIDINEELAKKYPCDSKIPDWTLARLFDGSPARP
ncbi:enolase C-terminal domain-like protein [Gracilibacillus timonensis]|uniref:enolase C-terminal domain-like protein n=1 Tax=Gracilibacillus timonensis TaxID=1816696 RepID=UPI0008253EBF|nr:enolase C-terminal domain-like protein [Gracilibacillus timonensis]